MREYEVRWWLKPNKVIDITVWDRIKWDGIAEIEIIASYHNEQEVIA